MPRRPANITQAELARVIRAVPAAGLPVHRVGKNASGRLLDGSTHDGMPEVRP